MLENLPELSVAALTTLCAVACGLSILLGGGLFLVLRSGLLWRLFGAAGGLLNGDDALGREGLFGDESTTSARPHVPTQGRAADRVAEIRARYDQAFDSGRTPPSTADPDPDLADAHPSALTDVELRRDKARYKRRFRQENPDLDDEMDAFFDDMQL